MKGASQVGAKEKHKLLSSYVESVIIPLHCDVGGLKVVTPSRWQSGEKPEG